MDVCAICSDEADWRWHGKGLWSRKYCDDHIQDKLRESSDLPYYARPLDDLDVKIETMRDYHEYTRIIPRGSTHD